MLLKINTSIFFCTNIVYFKLLYFLLQINKPIDNNYFGNNIYVRVNEMSS